MVDFPVSDAEYLAATVHPTLEIGLEELLKVQFPKKTIVSKQDGESVDPPIRWLAKWLKQHNSSNTSQRLEQSWNNALQKVQMDENDIESCCRNLVNGVKEGFWPIQVCNFSLAGIKNQFISLFLLAYACFFLHMLITLPIFVFEQAYVAVCDTVTETIPVEQTATTEEGEEEAPSEPAAADDEPVAPQTRTIEVDILRYVASSHPGKPAPSAGTCAALPRPGLPPASAPRRATCDCAGGARVLPPPRHSHLARIAHQHPPTVHPPARPARHSVPHAAPRPIPHHPLPLTTHT
jgi:hypothetical protein